MLLEAAMDNFFLRVREESWGACLSSKQSEQGRVSRVRC